VHRARAFDDEIFRTREFHVQRRLVEADDGAGEERAIRLIARGQPPADQQRRRPPLVLGGGTLQYTGATASTDRNSTLTASTTSTVEVTTSTTTLTMSGTTTATNGSLSKAGAGTLKLSGTNLHTGTTTVSAGTLLYGASNVLATGPVTVSGGALDLAGYTDTVGAVTLTSGSITGGAFGSTGALPITSEVDPNASIGSATDLSGSFARLNDTQFRATVTGTITAGSDGDWDYWKVPLRAGDTIQIEGVRIRVPRGSGQSR
jgi:autotransporter-associated beta strand protein